MSQKVFELAFNLVMANRTRSINSINSGYINILTRIRGFQFLFKFL